MRSSARRARAGSDPAALFAALGDQTRLKLISRLCREGPSSITSLASGFDITRQAITKHLQVMQHAGLVRRGRRGRESIWRFDRRRLKEIRRHLEAISKHWDDALGRLRDFVEG